MTQSYSAVAFLFWLLWNLALGYKTLLNSTVEPVFLNSSAPQYVSSTWEKKAPWMVGRRQVVTLLASVTFGADPSAPGLICTKAMEIALDRLHAQTDWLAGYELQIELINDEYSESTLISNVAKRLKYYQENGPFYEQGKYYRLPLYLADNFSPLTQKLTSTFFRLHDFMTVVELSAADELTGDRHRYSATLVLSGSASETRVALADLIKSTNWHRVALFGEIDVFFDSMEIRFVHLLDERNISLVWMGKMGGMSDVSGGLARLTECFEAMAALEVRIVLVDAVTLQAAFTCMAYRFGMYGPNYVHFHSDYNYFHPDFVDLPPEMPWCTRDILKKVYNSVYFYGEESMPSNFDNAVKDSSGLSFADLKKEISDRLVGTVAPSSMGFWTPTCYDGVLFSGLLLNEASRKLQSDYNATLTSMRPGPVYQHVLNDSAFQLDLVKGFKSQFRFDLKSSANPLRFIPMRLSKVQADNQLMVYKLADSHERVVNLNRKLKWRTPNGTPPVDSLTYVRSERMVTSLAEAIILLVIGVLAIVSYSFLVIAPFVSKANDSSNNQRRRLAFWEARALVGNSVMLAHLLTYIAEVVRTDHENEDFCVAFTALIAIGFSISLAGSVAKMNFEMRHHTEISPGGQFRISRHYRVINEVKSSNTVALLAWAVLQLALIAGWLSLRPIKRQFYQMSLEVVESTSIAYDWHRFDCTFTNQGNEQLGLFGAYIVLNILVSSGGAYLAYWIIAKGKTGAPKLTAMGFYCKVITIGAGALIAALKMRDARFVQLTVSSSTICYGAIDIVVFILSLSNSGKANVRQSSNVALTIQNGRSVVAL